MPSRTQASSASRTAVVVSLNRDLVSRARAAGLDFSAVAERAVSAALAQRERAQLAQEIAEGCRAHAEYLAEYGSLSDAVRALRDAVG